jgi:endonuclease/exonuclease/phosphatase family metal-dependent hydrolase
MSQARLPDPPVVDTDPPLSADPRTPHDHAAADTVLEHDLQSYFPALTKFRSTPELFQSELYARLRPEIERVMNGVVVEDHTEGATPAIHPTAVSAIAWNIERGNRLEGIIHELREHDGMRDTDLLLLTELDYGMVRSRNLFIARELAQALKLHFAFAPCYLSLVKGSGVEYYLEGENTLALHGNAILSRFPLSNVHSVALPNGKDKMRGKEQRLGNQRAVIADIEHPAGAYRAVSLHLDAHSSQKHRYRQMKLILDHLDILTPQLPVIIGGDWNTSTYNSRKAWLTIVGFFRRVAMGVRHVITYHYLYPERWFDRHLFQELDRRGYDYRNLNHLGAGTLHYHIDDLTVNTNLGDWVPAWCFWFLRKALEPHDGRSSLKLDWFAGKGIAVAPDSQPHVINGLRDDQGILSDHDPIVLDFVPVAGSR